MPALQSKDSCAASIVETFFSLPFLSESVRPLVTSSFLVIRIRFLFSGWLLPLRCLFSSSICLAFRFSFQRFS